ncbi:MAG: DUF7594 domain-containing protein [Actinomycetota bacterium]
MPAAAADGFDDVGYEGAPFFPAAGSITGEKPESKVWWNDGSWWASMFAPTPGEHHIFRLDGTSQTWVDTGIVLDTRAGSRADVLWDESIGKLYVASHSFSSPSGGSSPAYLYRLSYDSGTDTYSMDPGFPVQINNASTETLVIDKDAKGQIWATWVAGSKVTVNRTVCSPGCDDATWGTAFVPALDGTSVAGDDISTLVNVGGDIGLMWSNQSTAGAGPRFLFSLHDDAADDTTWPASEVAFGGAGNVDDHLNIKVDDTGRLFAAVKTSRTGATDTLNALLVRAVDGTWTMHPFGTYSDHHTRPIVVLDEANQMVHMLATAAEAGGTIFRKSSPLSAVSFAAGVGDPFIRDASDANLNNATTSKQNADATSGMLVLASNGTTRRYWHNLDPLDGSTLPGNSAPSGVSDFYTTPVSTQLVVPAPGVLSNDIDADTDPLTAVKISDPTTGSLSFSADGSFTYTPPTNFAGTVTFQYEADDGRVRSAATNVTIGVGTAGSAVATLVADSHVRSNQPDSTFGSSSELRSYLSGSTRNDSFMRFSVAGSGTVESATLRLFVTNASPSGGSVFQVGDTTWSESGLTWNNKPAVTGSALATLGAVSAGTWVEIDVTSVVGSSGEFAFSVEGASNDLAVFSSKEGVNAPELVITVQAGPPPPNSPPVAVADSYAATADTPLVVAAPGVLGNDSDVDADVLSAEKINEPENGTVTLNTNGGFTYTPAPGFTGTDAFSYRAFDGEAFSNVVGVELTVAEQPPTSTVTAVAAADTHARSNQPDSTFGSSAEMRSYLSGSTHNDSFVRFSVAGGTGTVQSAMLRLFVTNASTSGGTVFQVGSTSWAESTLTWNNRPAVTGSALGSLGAVSASTWVEVDVTSAVADPTGDYAFSVQGASNDLAVFSSKEGANAPELVVTVLNGPPPPNSPPVAVADAYAAFSGVPLVVAAPGVLGNDTDVDPDVLTAEKISDPVNGTVSLASDGSFTYTAGSGFTGTDAFTYRAFDGEAFSDVVSVELTVTEQPATTTVTVSAAADGHVRSNQPDKAFGSSAELRSYLRGGTSNESFVRFTGAGGTGAVQSATLRLFVTNASVAGGNVFQVGDTTWDESTLTWNTRPAVTGTALASLGAVAVGTWVEVDVTAVVGAGGDYAFSVQGLSTDLAVFSSKEGTNAPELVIVRAN